MSMIQGIRTFLIDESGATAIEYVLIASGISIAIVVGVGTVGDNLKAVFETDLAGAF